MHSGLNAVAVGRHPHICVLVHHAAAGVEEVVVLADLRQALGTHAVGVVVGLSVAGHEAGLDELAVRAKAVPAVAAQLRGLRICRAIGHERTVVPCKVVRTVQLIQTVDHLHAVDGEIQLAVLGNDRPFAIDRVGDKHLTVCIKVVHSGLDAVIIGGDPYICVLVHQAAGGVEEVVVLTDLRQAFCALALNKVVSTAIDVHEPVDHHLAIGIEMISPRLDRITIRLFDPVIAVTNDFAVGCARIVEGAIDTDQSFANLHAVNIVVLRSITRANAVFGCIVVMDDDAIGIKAILVSRQRQVVILVHLIVAVFYRLTVFAKVVIVIMRLCLAADIDADQTRECNILAVGDPVGIRSLDAQTVFANLGKLCSICRIGSNGNDLLIPTRKHIAITRSFGFFGRAREGRCFPLLIHLSGLRTVNDPSDHSAGFGNDLALFQKLIANTAVSITGIAVLCEGSIPSTADDLMMSLCRNFLLRNEYLAADGAVLALRLTGLGAGGLDCRVNDHGVPLGRDHFLRNDDLAADRAVLALRLAGLGAGRPDCGVNDYGVSLSRDHFLRDDDLAADRAVLALRLAGLGAGRPDCGVNDYGVSLSRDHFLRDDDLAADRAVLALRLTRLGAGGLDCRVNDYSVFLSRDHFLRNDDLAANGAMLARGQAGLCAGRFDCRVNDHGVPLSGDFFQAGEDRTASRALRAGLMAGLGAGGRFFGDLNRRVAGRADGLCFGLLAARAGKRPDTGVFTSRSGRDHTIVPSVAKRGNDLAVCDLFVTILTVGVAGVAGRGAGSLLRTAKLRILMRARLSAPDAVDIVNGIAGLGRLRLGVGAVGVVELCGGDRN